MILRHGIVGLILILIFQIVLFLRIQPLANFYFPFIWFGYILLIDSIVYKLKSKSLIYNHFKKFILMLILSTIFWWIFEWINAFKIHNWQYIGAVDLNMWISLIYRTISFSTVLPAIWETYDLIKAIHLFDKSYVKKKYKIAKSFLYGTIVLGVITFFLPFFYPTLMFPLVWLSFFLILDPINYLQNQHSIIGYLKDGKLKIPLSLMLAGLMCGFFWEFWNYWAPIKWVYNIPYVGFLKIFEMPILGYLGYLFFAWEFYAIYHFCKWLIKSSDILK